MRIHFGLFLVLCAVMIAGCGSGGSYGDPVEVTLTFKLDGEPLSEADVTITAMKGIPADRRTRTGKTGTGGEVKLDEVYPAEYIVRVNRNVAHDPENPSATTGDPALAKYSGESPLRAKVTADTTAFTFDDLTSE